MSDRVVNIVIAGLGGQGVITASDILAEAALRTGLDVKKAEVHGMSQRGGLVSSDVRFGEQVFSPMVPPGEADYLVLLAPTELDAMRGCLRPDGLIIGTDLVAPEALPNRRSLNVALLGALSIHLDLPADLIREAMLAALPEKLHATNEDAFEIGRAAAQARLGAPDRA
jgi:indolepyruvate ferredoxin oxidoreductase beta subunit